MILMMKTLTWVALLLSWPAQLAGAEVAPPRDIVPVKPRFIPFVGADTIQQRHPSSLEKRGEHTVDLEWAVQDQALFSASVQRLSSPLCTCLKTLTVEEQKLDWWNWLHPTRPYAIRDFLG